MSAPWFATPWFATLPPATAAIGCQPGRHRLRWEAGQLIADDHPDAEAELVLAALGGEHQPCVRTLRAWGAHSDDLDVLAIGPRSAADDLKLLKARDFDPAELHRPPGIGSRPMQRATTGAVRRATSRSWIARSGAPRTDLPDDRYGELLGLFHLGTDFQLRLSATVAASWAERSRAERSRAEHSADSTARAMPALTAALTGRLAPAAARWLRIDPDRVDVTCYDGDGWGELELTGAGLRAALPVGWLASVWAAGLAVTRGLLVVGVTSVTWPAAELLAVHRPGSEPVTVRATHRGGRWSVSRR